MFSEVSVPCPVLPTRRAVTQGHPHSPKTTTALLIGYACTDAQPLQSCLTLQPHGPSPARLLCPWGFSRREYWSGLPCPPPGDLLDTGIEPMSLEAPSSFMHEGPPAAPGATVAMASLSPRPRAWAARWQRCQLPLQVTGHQGSR